MQSDLMNEFGKIVRTSRDSGLRVAADYRSNILPKVPDTDQAALVNLIESLSEEQFQFLQQGLKNCIELSLFKLISTIESGMGNVTFALTMHRGTSKILLVGERVDNDLVHEYWNWVS